MGEIFQFLLIFAVAAGAGVVNTLVGGGTTIVLPLLVFLGMPPLVANGTNRLAVACQSIAALASLRAEGVLRWRAALPLTGVALAGGIGGALVAKEIDEKSFQTVMGWLLLGGIPLLFVRGGTRGARAARPGEAGEDVSVRAAPSPLRNLLGLAGAFLCGVYGGFLGAGVGVLIMIFLAPLAGLTLTEMLPVKILMVMGMSAAAAGVYLSIGFVDWKFALPLIAGNVAGGIAGARLALAAGDRRLRLVTAAVGAALAVLMICKIA